jgi:protein O-GlcNAc transferase
MTESRYNDFSELYAKAESCKDATKSQEMYYDCLAKSTVLINDYETLNYLELFRISDKIIDTYYKNARLIISFIGLNETKELSKENISALQIALHRLKKCLDIDPLNDTILELFKETFMYITRFVPETIDKIKRINDLLKIKPVDYMLHLQLGLYYMEVNDLDNAMLHYKISWYQLQLIDNVQMKVKCLDSMGTIYSHIQDRNLAAYYFKKALELSPTDSHINNQLGALYTLSRNTELAINHYNTGIKHSTDTMTTASLYMNMGMAYTFQCNFTKAIECYNTALKYQPKLSLAYQNKLLDLNYISHEIDDVMYVSKCHKAINQIFPQVITGTPDDYVIKKDILKLNKTLPFLDKIKTLQKNNTKLNIGFVSGDFINHPVSYFITGVLQHMNPDLFNIFCFSGKIIKTPENLSQCEFINTRNMSNVTLKETIKSKHIDILFDLSAHTGDNRLDTFVLKPAPIQISYCGYPGTSGIRSMDYHITDNICNSTDTQKYYTEKLVFMKHCFLTYQSHEKLPKLIDTQPCKTNGYITFGTFNKLSKINSSVISVYKTIMKKIPDCKFIIKNGEFITEKLRKNFLENFTEPERITIINYADTFEQHMDIYNQIDISLDTFPYSGTTTSCESLSMGVPVITLNDNIRHYHSQNVTSSLLVNSGLSEYISYSQEEYIQKCIDYSKKISDLNLKKTTRQKFQNGFVCDTENFTIEFSEMLITLYKNHTW